jgi:hypothetical protein
VGAFSVSCSFRSVEDYFEWAFAGVYGPNVSTLTGKCFGMN